MAFIGQYFWKYPALRLLVYIILVCTCKFHLSILQVAHFYNSIDQQMIESQKPMMLQSALAFEQIIKVKEFPSFCIFNFSDICAYSTLLFLCLLLDCNCNLSI